MANDDMFFLISPPFCIKSFSFSAYSNSHWAADEGWCHTYPFLLFMFAAPLFLQICQPCG
jgi:hypothetical protein